jgi:hypothetical protein
LKKSGFRTAIGPDFDGAIDQNFVIGISLPSSEISDNFSNNRFVWHIYPFSQG